MGGESLLMLDWLANPEVPLEIHASGDSALIDVRHCTPTMYVFSIIASYILTTYMQPIETL